MKPGLLRYRLLCYMPPKDTDDAFGAQRKPEFTLWRPEPIYAGRGKISGKVVNEAGELFELHYADFNVRTGYPVDSGWRVEEMESGTLYDVDTVDVNVYKGMKTLKCRKVNK